MPFLTQKLVSRMQQAQICIYEDLEFLVIPSKKRKRTIVIQITKAHGIEVKVPYSTSMQHILDLIKDRYHWITEKLNNIKTAPRMEIKAWHEREQLYYLGQAYPLHIETFPFAKKRAECTLENAKIILTHSQNITTCAEQKIISQKTLENWYREQAKTILTERTQHFAKLMQVQPQKIIIKTQKNRWGSCDRHHNLRYNWKIIMTPIEQVDYLVVHELAHIKVKNHSKKFWDFVATVMPDHKQRRKQLRDFARDIVLL